MKIAYLTAGAAGMFCGSCLHDNALAKSLSRLGHDCILVPIYTPIRTDEEDVSIDQVFIGGINVYLQQKMPWLAYVPRWMDSFLNHGRLINPLTKNAGKTSPKLLGALSVSMLRGTQGRQRKEFNRLLDWLQKDIEPDVVVFTNLLIGGGIPNIKRRSNAKVFVTLQGDDIFLDSLPDNFRSQAVELMRGIVPLVDGFLVHSTNYAHRMADLLNIPDNKIQVVPLGIDVTEFRNQRHLSTNPDSYTIGYLARMAPEKGLHRLVDAFISIADQADMRHVKLKMAGWMGPQHTEYWETQKNKLAKAGLQDRWEYFGTIDRTEKGTFLRATDLFCVPTTYEEPKGLFLLEAVAAGTPYVQPNHGAFPEIHQRLQSILGERKIGHLFQANSMDDLCLKLMDAIRTPKPSNEAHPSVLDEIDISKHASRILEIFRNTLVNG